MKKNRARQLIIISNSVHRDEAVRRGKESLRLGYTISQVVHGYGTLCQAITEYAGLFHSKVGIGMV